MFHGRSANELGLASAAVVHSLIQRLERKGGMQPQPPMRAVPERPSLRSERTDLPVRVTRDEAGKLIPIDLKAGDRVLFGKWSGTES